MSQGRLHIDGRSWKSVLVAAVLVAGAIVLGIGAHDSAGEPAASASTPSVRPTRSIDGQQYACDTWNAARSNFLDARRRTDITLADPDATPADIHDRAVEVANTLDALENAVLIAIVNDIGNRDWALLIEAVQITRGLVEHAGDDPQKIYAAMHRQLIEKYEAHLLDVCRV